MFSDEQIEDIVRRYIESKEKLGTHSGGSGHMSDISYNIDDISEPEDCEEGCSVTFQYTIVVISEFTVWPDNPPSEHRYAKKIIIDEKGNITEDTTIKPYMDTGLTGFESDFEDIDLSDM